MKVEKGAIEMRHRVKGKRLGRNSDHRKAMLSNLAVELFEHKSIITTVSRAKEARRLAERMITFAKRGDLNARRQVLRHLRNKKITQKLFNEIAKEFEERNGGYTRIIRIGPRKGDGAERAILQLVKSGE